MSWLLVAIPLVAVTDMPHILAPAAGDRSSGG